MMKFPKKEQLFASDDIPQISEEQIKIVSAIGFKAFINTQKDQTLNIFEFFYIQLRIMKKSVWFIQAILIGLFGLYLHYVSADPIATCKLGLIAIVPLFVLASFPELWKNVNHGAIEVENTTYFNMKKIYLVRFAIYGITDLIGITLLIIIVSLKTSLPLVTISLYVLVPFVSTCCIALTVLSFMKSHYSSIYATGISVLWMLLLYQLVNYEGIYEKVQLSIWAMLILVSFLYLIWMIRKAMTQIELYFEKLQGGTICY